jgi:hypothetical protein
VARRFLSLDLLKDDPKSMLNSCFSVDISTTNDSTGYTTGQTIDGTSTSQ